MDCTKYGNILPYVLYTLYTLRIRIYSKKKSIILYSCYVSGNIIATIRVYIYILHICIVGTIHKVTPFVFISGIGNRCIGIYNYIYRQIYLICNGPTSGGGKCGGVVANVFRNNLLRLLAIFISGKHKRFSCIIHGKNIRPASQ